MKATYILVMSTIAFVYGNHTPDSRCQTNADCDEVGVQQCCGFVKQKEGNGEKGFTCYHKDNVKSLNVQCLDDGKKFCDYCAVSLYCCSYETNLVPGLNAWCKLNTTYQALAVQEYAKDQPLYRCLQKLSGTDYTAHAL